LEAPAQGKVLLLPETLQRVPTQGEYPGQIRRKWPFLKGGDGQMRVFKRRRMWYLDYSFKGKRIKEVAAP